MAGDRLNFRIDWRRVGRVLASFCQIGILIALATTPLWIIGFFANTSPWWPRLAPVLLLLVPPAIAATFGVYHTRIGKTSVLEYPEQVVGVWLEAWRRNLVRSLVTGLVVVAIVAIAIVNIGGFLGTQLAAIAIPLNVVVVFLAVATMLHLLVLFSERTAVTRDDATRANLALSGSVPGMLPLGKTIWACVALSVRRLHLTLLGLLAIFAAVSVTMELPPIGYVLLLPPLLWVAWAAFRKTLEPLLPDLDANRLAR